MLGRPPRGKSRKKILGIPARILAGRERPPTVKPAEIETMPNTKSRKVKV
jgi:hypothetical protein